MNNVQPIWADQFIKKIANSYMGLNLSRGKPIKYYSSDRIAQLMGNGLLTFNQRFPQINSLLDFDDRTIFETPEELAKGLNYFKNNLTEAKLVAKKNYNEYHKLYSSEKVCKYFLNCLFDKDLDEFSW